MKSILSIGIALIAICQSSKNIPVIQNQKGVHHRPTFCDRISLAQDDLILDSIKMDDTVIPYQLSILQNAKPNSVYLIYTDSIAVYDPENYTEYIKLTERKIPLRLIE